MDPASAVGLVASIVQLADFSFKIVKALDAIREGGKDRRRLCDEITLLWMTLRNLEAHFAPLSAEENGAWMKPIDSLAERDGVFNQLSNALNDVWGKLTTGDSRMGKALQTLRWPLDKDYVDKTIARIERLKTSVTLVVGQANIALAQEMQGDISTVKAIAHDNQFKEIIEWLSPLNFRQRQENITVTPGTGGWFFKTKQFQRWYSGQDRFLWVYGIPGGGKTYLASNAVNELRRLKGKGNAIVLVAFCSFDTSDSQSVDLLMSSLLKQTIQTKVSLPESVQAMYKKHHVDGIRPSLTEICNVLGEVLEGYEISYIILDALDELSEDSKRTLLLDSLQSLKGNPKVMVTSRRIESIAVRFGSVFGQITCDGCDRTNLPIYYHCNDCPDFDHCEDCRQKGESDAHRFVKKFSSQRIQVSAQPEDLESYVCRRIEVEEELRHLIDEERNLREKILNTVVENSKDMFLLARFHMDALAECLSIGQVTDALAHLPKEIDNTYDQAMARIKKLSSNKQRAVMKLLLWVTYAERPLTIEELEHATAISRGVRTIRQDHILSAATLTSLSSGLIIIDENKRVRFTHETAESYFKEKRSTLLPQGETELAECCIAYLYLDEFKDGPCEGPNEARAFDIRRKSYPFLAYAALHWGDHARKCDSHIVTPQALMLLRDEKHLEASVQALWYTDTKSENSWDVQGGVSALHIAAFFGLQGIVVALLDEGADPNSRDSLGTTPLIYSAARGYHRVADILLRHGASVSAMDNRGSTALLRAVARNNIGIVGRLLQEPGVDVNARNRNWKNATALMIACAYGYVGIVELLLERPDIYVNQIAFPGRPWNALLDAAFYNHFQCIEALFRHPSIDKNHQDKSGNSALIWAAQRGHAEAVQVLLRGGTNPELLDDRGGRAIHRAIDMGRYNTFKVLLEAGVECDFKDTLGRTLVHAAAVNNRYEILRLLLTTRKELDIDAQGSTGETALHDAARFGYSDSVKVLLEFGARTDIQNHSGRTPVRSAKDAGRAQVLEILLAARDKEQHTAGVNRADTFNENTELPLSLAVQFEDPKIVRARVSQCSLDEINAYSPDAKETPLHLACEYRKLPAARILLEAGAFVDPMDPFYRTPLIVACQRCDVNLIKLLIEHGANVNTDKFNGTAPWEIALNNSSNNKGREVAIWLLARPDAKVKPTSNLLHRALGWAAALGNLEACKKLIEAGAPVQLKNTKGFTPIQVAKGWKHPEVERYLFDEAAKLRASSTPKLSSTDPAGSESLIMGNDLREKSLDPSLRPEPSPTPPPEEMREDRKQDSANNRAAVPARPRMLSSWSLFISILLVILLAAFLQKHLVFSILRV